MLKIGILGAARIAPPAIIEPASHFQDIEIASIAARNPTKAHAFAKKYHISHIHASYESLISDPAIDIIYNPLPNSLHAHWTIEALKNGKHVLCEKPIASNTEEAMLMAKVAQETGMILAEAFHYRYHPMAQRMKALFDQREIGDIVHIESAFCVRNWNLKDIRYRLDLAGGALMDLGCYPIHLLRFLTGMEPTVVKAKAYQAQKWVDRYMEADLLFSNGMTAHIYCSMLSVKILRNHAKMKGTSGNITIKNPFVPHVNMPKNHILINKKGTQAVKEHIDAHSTYFYQLEAFKKAIQKGIPLPTHPEDALANMKVIDAIYEKAGFPLRGK